MTLGPTKENLDLDKQRKQIPNGTPSTPSAPHHNKSGSPALSAASLSPATTTTTTNTTSSSPPHQHSQAFFTPPLFPSKAPATGDHDQSTLNSSPLAEMNINESATTPAAAAAPAATASPSTTITAAPAAPAAAAAAPAASGDAAANASAAAPTGPTKQRPSTPNINTAMLQVDNNLAEPGVKSARSIPPTPTTAVGDQLHLRCLVTMKEAGIIIGKQGKNIADVREKSGARVMISELQPGAFERVITVSGSLDLIAKAFALLSTKVLEEMQLNSAASASGAAAQHHQQQQQQQHQDGTHSVRLLIAHNRMGGVIGKGGNKIKEIQEVSGARLNASEEMLPNSTERVITIRGVPDMIHMAVYHIGLVVLEGNDRSQDRSTIHYKPHAKYYTQPASAAAGGSGNMFSATAALASAMQPMSPGLYSPQTMHAPPLPAPSTRPHPHMQQQGSNGNGNGRGGPRANNGGSSASGTPVIPPGHEQQQIFIPNDMVGCIIGKGGARINEIRANSACHIRVAETGNAQGERLITIVGPPEGCQRALYMLYHRLEEEKKRATERE